MKRIFWSLALGVISAFAVSAATLGVGPTDTNPDANFTATIDTTAGTINLATPNGPDELTVSGIGNVFVFDQGTPGTVIASLNLGATEAVALTFNTTASSIDGSGNFEVPAIGAAVTGITDPGLAALIGSSNFIFASTGSTTSPFVFDFTLATLPTATTGVPEPAVAFTIGIGLLGISALRLRKRAR
jgi:hypothetical protein